MKEDRRPPFRERENPLNYLYRLRIGGDIPGLMVVAGITLLFFLLLTGSLKWGFMVLGLAAAVALAIYFFAGRWPS